MGVEEKNEGVAFNMAVATLQRIDMILRQTTVLDLQYANDPIQKQIAYIDLIKRLFSMASPLLFGLDKKKEGEEKTETETMQENILDLKIEKRTKIRSGNQTIQYIFSPELDKRMQELLVIIQKKLSPYMMPKGTDPKYGWGQGE